MPDSVSGPEGPGPQNRKLAALCGIPLSTAQFLRLAISIVKSLVELHQRNLAHKNITPATIFFDPLNYAATFSDLSPSANSVAPESTNETSDNLAETLAYLSPEQTGRTNQNIDHRSDLYSLGVIFYQLYTGVLPFQATDAPGWVHCHLARVPRTPAEIIPTLSPTVANLIMKLLAKTVDERYQTASALLTDLEKCYINWTTEGEITPFSLGKNDIPNHLLIPSRLYGRQEELTLLQSSFKRVISQASAEMVIITGYSGIGKSALVSELYKTIIRQHGQFIAVKFDQYKRNIPYLTIAEAFQELIHQILKSDRDQIDLWRTRFQQSMGCNAQLIIDMIPKFELIIGPQSPLENVLPHAAQNRFTRIFLEFIHVFTTEYPSLTIFFDDLQWADPASLKLIEDLISDSESHDLLLIGAYRNNGVDASHALMQTLNKLDQVGIKLQTLTLAPLTLIELGQMLADIFLMPQPKLSALTRLIYHKTAGNPFFTIQFLGSLHSEGLIFFDRSQEHWNWNLAGIEAQQLTDNVVTLMTMKLRKLSPETQEILSLAACIGNHFEFDTLREISPFSACELRQPLAEALQEDLIQHQSLNTLTFIHDRVQQACYLLIPTSQRPAVHLRIGRLMLKCCPLVQPEETLFDTVHQLNQGAALLTSPLEKKELAQLNLRAGIKAKTATAYIAARNYFVSGTRLLVESVWQTDYALAFELFKGLAEAEYLNSNYTASKQQLELLLNLANTDLEKAELYNILIVQDTLLGNYSEAIQSGCKALRLLDIIVPKTNLKAKLNSLLETNKSMLQERPFSSLLEAAEMSDPKRIASLELLSNMVVPARYTDSTLFALIAVLNVNISLRFGLTPKSTVGYTAYGMVLNSVMGQYQQALEFGELSLQLSERFNAPAQKCQACFMIGHYLNHWVRPLKLADDILVQGIQAGLAAGEMQWTGYIYAYKLFQPFYRGMNPALILEEIPALLAFTRKTKNQWATDTLQAIQLALGSLYNLDGCPEPQGEKEFYTACEQHRSFGAKGRYAVLKMQIHYLYDREKEAQEAAQEAAELLDFFSSSISIAHYYFYHSLILLTGFAQQTTADKKKIRKSVQGNQQRMKIWATQCSENFGHLYLLVEAERSRINHREFDAQKLYLQAILKAQQNGTVQDEALANELTARFYRQNNFDLIADAYLTEARSCYLRWGAASKVEKLDRQFPKLAKTSLPKNDQSLVLSTDSLDAIALVKASQAISDKIHLPDLLNTLMQVMLENAGAEKGCLILAQTETLSIAVTARITTAGDLVVHQQGRGLQASSLPVSLINYVQRTQETTILDNPLEQGSFTDDAYFARTKPLSVLCLPVLHQSNLIGILYLENNLALDIFTPDRIKVLELLAAQAAISLENALLYSERRQAEEALQFSNEKYRAIFENSGTALIFIEDDTTISICNKEFQTLTGFNKDEIESHMKWSEFVATSDDLQRMQEYHRLRRSEPGIAPQIYEFLLRTCTGELKNILASVTNMPESNQTLASLLDITERKQAEDKVVKMATIIDQAAEGITLTDKNWVIQYANPAFAQITGYSQDEIIGQRTTLLKSNAHSKEFYQDIRKTLRSGNVWSGRIINKKKDGTLYEVDATGSPVRDDSGAICNFVGIQRDITNEIKLEHQLQQAQKMEAIGTLAGGIAHDFNNILSAILGYSQLLSNKLATDSPLHKYLDHIQGASHRATDLIKQILTYSRQAEQKRKPVQIDQIITEVLKLIRATIPASIEIVTKIAIAPKDAVILADETQLHQVLMNLCTNAAHAIGGDGGILTLSLVPLVIDSAEVSLYPNMPQVPYVKLQIKDNGQGITQENLKRIFDPYFTTKAAGEGTGLGLSVVQGIVENHGGRISVHSEVGSGTCFSLLLPTINETHQCAGKEKKTTPRGNEQILFVDDEVSLIIMGKEMLEDLGYRVRAVASSLEALELFRLQPEAFDLIITDRTMPGLTGDKLARQIIKIRPDIPIILCTGFAGDGSMIHAEETGVSEIITKPYDIELLATSVRKLIDQTQEDPDGTV